MAYNANIPQATDQLSQSQLDLLNNFIAINGWVQVNHVGFNVANAGKHGPIELVLQTVDPTVNGEIGLGNYNLPLTGISELWVSLYNSTPAYTSYPISASILSTNANPGPNTIGWSYLPSGCFMKWGRTALGANPTVITIGSGTAGTGPAFSNPPNRNMFNVQLTAVPTGTVYLVSTNPNLQQISVGFTGGATSVNWLIIGA